MSCFDDALEGLFVLRSTAKMSRCNAVCDDGHCGGPVKVNLQLLWKLCFLHAPQEVEALKAPLDHHCSRDHDRS